MTLLTEATDVFAAAETGGRCLVAFVAKRQPLASGVFGSDQALRLKDLLQTLKAEGWLMSVRAMFEPNAPAEPYVFDTGFAHDADMVGAFEAPSLSAALAGTVRLEQAGWARRFATESLLGPREFSTVQGRGEWTDHSWGFLALWEWNDAWSATTRAERRAYDEECDVAFIMANSTRSRTISALRSRVRPDDDGAARSPCDQSPVRACARTRWR